MPSGQLYPDHRLGKEHFVSGRQPPLTIVTTEAADTPEEPVDRPRSPARMPGPTVRQEQASERATARRTGTGTYRGQGYKGKR